MKLSQERTPIFDALKNYINQGTIPFHVPGHKQGRGLPEFAEFVGENVLKMDLTCLPDTDNICNAFGPIREAEDLAAEAYGADRAFFLINGTTSGIQTMIMTVCQPGDKIIIPRNAHKSAIGGLILSGAIPIYLEPELHPEFGIAMCITPESVEKALEKHPDAKAVFVVNPIYYGAAADLAKIVDIAHLYGVPVMVDEAHGGHLKFHSKLPLSAIEAGADLVACSTHKLAGSMTQSSMLLVRNGLINPMAVKAVMNLTQTTSPSYVLLASLDLARKQLALRGREIMEEVLALASWLRSEISATTGYRLMDESIVGHYGCFDLDPTKITVNVTHLGMSGYQMEKLLRSEYKIQIELSDLYNVIFIVTLGDNKETVSQLIYALKDIAEKCSINKVLRFCPPLPAIPEIVVSPREAFYDETKKLLLQDSVGEISAESIMAYPPGIPLICPGERITKEIVDYVQVLKQENADLQGTEDISLNEIKVLAHRLVILQPNDQDIPEVI